MKAEDLMKEWRIWMLITALIGAALAIGPHYATVETDDGQQTVIQTNINKGLELAGGARVLIQPDTEGMTPQEREETAEQIITTLKTRVQAFGLQDMTIRSVNSLTSENSFIQVEMAGASTEQLRELISRQGQFRAALSLQVADTETLTIDGSNITIRHDNNTVTVNDEEITVNESVTATAGDYEIPVRYRNSSQGIANLELIAFTGEDITGVDINPSQSGIQGSGDSWQFQFQVSILQESAQRFQAIAENFEPSGQYLAGTQLVLSLDDSVVSSLNVASAFGQQVITSPSITGGADSREGALQDMNELKSVLQSGALPVSIDVVSTDTVSPTLGAQFMQTAIIAILMAVVAVALVIFIRYQTPQVALPIMITGFSEVIILLGVFSDGAYLFESTGTLALTLAAIGIPTIIGMVVGLSQGQFSSLLLPLVSLFVIGIIRFSTSLDLASIAGIIAAVGTGVDDQIIITDERLEGIRNKVRSLTTKLKRAFFIIFTSAASTIGAMLPVMAIGAGAVQGFAITTILGVIIGITITRPAYAKIIERLDL